MRFDNEAVLVLLGQLSRGADDLIDKPAQILFQRPPPRADAAAITPHSGTPTRRLCGIPRPVRPHRKQKNGRVYDPANGFPVLPVSVLNSRRHIDITAVRDPWGDGTGQIRALRRRDLLAHEHAAGLIDDAALAVGRDVERILEHGSRIGAGAQWRQGDRVDAATAHEIALTRGVLNAKRVRGLVTWIRREIGPRDAKIVVRVLGDRLSYSEVAAREGKNGERGAWYIANRFRDASRP